MAMAIGRGIINLSHNWVSPNAAKYWFGKTNNATVNGWSGNIGANNSPVFKNESAHDFRPAVGSPLIDAGINIVGGMVPAFEPVSLLKRMQNGVIDIGAFEY